MLDKVEKDGLADEVVQFIEEQNDIAVSAVAVAVDAAQSAIDAKNIATTVANQVTADASEVRTKHQEVMDAASNADVIYADMRNINENVEAKWEDINSTAANVASNAAQASEYARDAAEAADSAIAASNVSVAAKEAIVNTLEEVIDIRDEIKPIQTDINSKHADVIQKASEVATNTNAAVTAAANAQDSETSAAASAAEAKLNANQVIAGGGLFTVSADTPYPDATGIARDTLWIVRIAPFDNPNAAYTYTSGALSGKIIKQGWQLFYETPANVWSIIPLASTGIVSINGNTDIEQKIGPTNVGGRYVAAPDKMPIANAAGFISDKWLLHLPKPKLQLDLEQSINFQSSGGECTFTRTTAATMILRNGDVKAYAEDEPRLSKDGLLLEGASTNYVANSESITSDFAVNATKTVDGIWTSINSTDTAQTAYVGISSGNSTVAVGQPKTVTMSMFVKKRSQSNSFLMHLGGANIRQGVAQFNLGNFTAQVSNGVSNPKVEKYGNVYRVSATFEVTATGGTGRIPYVLLIVLNGAINSHWTSRYQIEELPYVTSYIPTTNGAVTRNADSLVIPYDLSANTPFTMALTVKTVNRVTTARPIAYGGFKYLMLRLDDAAQDRYSFYYSGTGIKTTSASGLFTLTYDGGNQTLYCNGQYTSSVGNGAVDVNQHGDKCFKFNSDTDIPSANNYGGKFFGYVKGFKLWEESFTMYELEEIV